MIAWLLVWYIILKYGLWILLGFCLICFLYGAYERALEDYIHRHTGWRDDSKKK